MKSWLSKRLRNFRESVRWRGPFITALLLMREIFRPLFYFYVWHIFETDITHQVPEPYAKEDLKVTVFKPEERQIIPEEQISEMGELNPDEVRLRFERGDLIAVAFAKERPVGYMWIALSNGLELAFDTYWIIRPGEAVRYGSFVVSEYRGRGIHSFLNSTVISYLFKNGIKLALGSVSLLNPQSMSLPKHYKKLISMKLFIARIRGINWTIRKSFRAPLDARFSWPKKGRLLREALPLLEKGEAPRITQDHSQATYYSFPSSRRKLEGQRTTDQRQPARTHEPAVSAPLHWFDPLKDARWSAFIQKHPRASVFHTLPWLEALCRTYGYRPVVCTTTPPGAALQNGILFCEVRSWITGRRLVSLPFSDNCEPLMDSTAELESALRQLEAGCCNGAWKYAEIRPSSRLVMGAPLACGFRPEKTYYLHTVDLRPPEEVLLKCFHKTCVQYRIRKAEREGLRCEFGRSDATLENFFRLHLLTRRRHGVPTQPKAWFRNLVHSMRDALEIGVAWHGQVPVAGILVLRFKHILVFKYGCSDKAYHKTGSVPFLLWRTMQRAKSDGFTLFDLGRSDTSDEGLIRFKDHLVNTRRIMTYWRYPERPAKKLAAEDRTSELAKHLVRYLPDFAVKALGDLAYRHIG